MTDERRTDSNGAQEGPGQGAGGEDRSGPPPSRQLSGEDFGEGLDPNGVYPADIPPDDLPPDDLPPKVFREVRRRFRVGLLLTGAAFLGLLVTGAVPFLDAVGLAFFFFLLPTLAIAQLPLMTGMVLERVPVYLGSILSIGILGLVGGLLALRLDPPAPASFTWLPLPELLLWSVGLTVAAIGVILLFRPLEARFGGGRPELLRDLLPRTGRERRVFALLSLAAGVGEELAYRAYAFLALQMLGLGPWTAAVVASVPFGFLHAYQGPVGVVRTGVMGFVLAVPVVITGSLLPSMVAHTLIDLVVGLILGPRLLTGSGEVAPAGSAQEASAGSRNGSPAGSWDETPAGPEEEAPYPRTSPGDEDPAGDRTPHQGMDFPRDRA